VIKDQVYFDMEARAEKAEEALLEIVDVFDRHGQDDDGIAAMLAEEIARKAAVDLAALVPPSSLPRR
jgi:hypothetical protein